MDQDFQRLDRVIVGGRFAGYIAHIETRPGEPHPTYRVHLDEAFQGRTYMDVWAFDMRHEQRGAASAEPARGDREE